MHKFVACLLLVLLSSQLHAQPVIKGAQAEKIDQHLQNLVPFGFSGAIAIEKDGELILKKAYGLADRQTKQPLTESTPFIIGSLAKQITAAAILKLESEGKLRVIDALSKFWPDAPKQTRDLTLHQLMSHSSGLPYFSNSSLMEQKPRAEKMHELLQLEPQFTPASQFSYSNPGYTLLAGVIEKASGMSFENYLRTKFFTPLGMSETGFVSESSRWTHGPHSYSDGNDEGPLSGWQEGAEFAGAGNVISTIGDMYKWETALSTSKVLPDTSRAKLFTAHIATQGKNGYGYGWNVNQTIRNTRIVAHAGDLGGYNSDFRRYIDEGYTIIFLSNAREGGRGYRDAAMNPTSLMLTGANLPVAPKMISLSSVAVNELQGTYSKGVAQLRLRSRDGIFQLNAPDQAAMELVLGAQFDSITRLISATTRKVLEDLKDGEFSSLRENLSPSFPFEDSKMGFAQLLQGGELGALKEIRIDGSTFAPPMSARSYFTLVFEKGTREHSFAWMAGKIGGAKDEPAQGLSLTFVPISETQFVNFDPFSGKQIALTIEGAKLRVNGVELAKQ
ncbi:MAG TPA: serine hydrolase domain-containing protein [Candidatus Kapabacteria bacterium]|nr:serine hydrolase domain-containing protein [Candidatus Kapabacteria bacterium]